MFTIELSSCDSSVHAGYSWYSSHNYFVWSATNTIFGHT